MRNQFVFGVDVGGTTVKMGLFTAECKLLRKWEIPTDTENHGKKVLPDVAESICRMMRAENIDRADVLGIGICVPGAVDHKGTVYGAENLGWGTFNISQELENLLCLPVKAANDANVAALGEMLQGGGKGYRNVVMITLGTGVGGGIISDGRLLTGAIGACGEIGHMHIEDNEVDMCACGCVGCLEQYASATGIAKMAKKHLAVSDMPSLLRKYDKVTAMNVFDAVKKQDVLAIEIAEAFGRYLGKGLAIIAAVLNPEAFVIGGGVSKAGEVLLDYIRPAFDEYAFPSIKNTEFKIALLENDAGVYGAAGLILDDGKR